MLSNALQPSVIRPGLLVSLRTTVRGGVSYQRVDLDNRTEPTPGSMDAKYSVVRWETTREIADVAEYEAATKARDRARAIVARVCCPTSFGLLCPEASQSKLTEAVADAMKEANDHNRKARHTRVDVYVICGRVADNDEQAARAVAAEVRELIDAMQAGVKSADPVAIRAAANKARAVAGMLAPDAQMKVSAAIAEVRSVAREIVQRVGKAGETAASVVDGLQLERLTAARFAVLDVGDETPSERIEIAAIGRDIDLEPSAPAIAEHAMPSATEIDIEKVA